jgi:hypothetical protein
MSSIKEKWNMAYDLAALTQNVSSLSRKVTLAAAKPTNPIPSDILALKHMNYPNPD